MYVVVFVVVVHIVAATYAAVVADADVVAPIARLLLVAVGIPYVS